MFYVLGQQGEKYGPASMNDLRKWAMEGRIAPETFIEHAQNGVKVRASEFADLTFQSAGMAPPPALPPLVAPAPFAQSGGSVTPLGSSSYGLGPGNIPSSGLPPAPFSTSYGPSVYAPYSGSRFQPYTNEPTIQDPYLHDSPAQVTWFAVAAIFAPILSIIWMVLVFTPIIGIYYSYFMIKHKQGLGYLLLVANIISLVGGIYLRFFLFSFGHYRSY